MPVLSFSRAPLYSISWPWKKNSYLLVLIYFKLHTKPCSPLVSWLACVAGTSGSVRFGSKERGTRVKDRAKDGASKRAGNRSIFRAAKPENPVPRRSCWFVK